MATIINNPDTGNSGSGVGWVAAVVIILILVIGAIYLLPRLRGGAAGGGTNINVQLPNSSGASGATTPAPSGQ